MGTAVKTGYPLTYAQKRLFFLHQMDTGTSAYAFPVHVRLRGPLDVAALEAALSDVVARHDILRSTIEVVDGTPVQIVHGEGMPLRVLDLRGQPAADRVRAADQAVGRELSDPFRFEAALARALLVRLEEQHFLLLLTFHHIIFDGWSFGVLAGELSAAYARHTGAPGAIGAPEPLEMQYGEYASIEAALVASEQTRADEDFWHGWLTPVPPPLALPTDRVRPPALSGAAERVWVYLDAGLTASLGRRARSERVTPYMLLLAGFQAVLARLAGQSDFCVGGGASGRHHPATRPMIGNLVNELVYRSVYEPGLTFGELIQRVRRTALEAYRHDRLPFERLVEVVTPPRSLSRHPLFQHAVTLQPDQGGEGLVLPGIETEIVDTGAEGSALDMAVSFHREGDRFACIADFSADLWDKPWVKAFVADLETMLRAMADDPAQAVDAIRLTAGTNARGADRAAPGSATPARETPEIVRAQDTVASIWREVLGLESLRPDENFFDIGGDSLLGLRVVAAARQAGYAMRPRHIFLGQTVKDLAVLLAGTAAAPAPATAVTAPAATSVPLLPIQSWFLMGQDADAGHYNFSHLFEVAGFVSASQLATAVDAALAHHDAFRLRIERSPSGEWAQSYRAEPPSGRLRLFDLSHLTQTRADRARDQAIRTCQASVRLDAEALVACALFTMPDGTRHLLITAHHLIMDPASMRIVADDIATACAQLARGGPAELLAQPSTYQDWALALKDFSRSDALRAELGYWRGVAERAPGDLRPEFPEGRNDVASQETMVRHLDRESTLALRAQASTGATLTELVLAAAAAALAPVVSGGDLLIDFETHGREDIFDTVDVSRTVGWFSALFPVVLATAPGATAHERLRTAMLALRGVPGNGLGHGVLAFMAGLLPRRRNRVGVTYLGAVTSGRHDSGAALILLDSAEHDRAPGMTRPHELEIGAIIVDDVLEFGITYSTNRFSQARITSLVEGMRAFFADLIADPAGPGPQAVNRGT
jgi:non-ribosomal peptide synthase protein (TIGR01720 family)